MPVSEDSQAHREQPGKGFVPIDDVVGRAFTIVWPLDRTQLLRRPATFDRARARRVPTLMTGTRVVGSSR